MSAGLGAGRRVERRQLVPTTLLPHHEITARPEPGVRAGHEAERLEIVIPVGRPLPVVDRVHVEIRQDVAPDLLDAVESLGLEGRVAEGQRACRNGLFGFAQQCQRLALLSRPRPQRDRVRLDICRGDRCFVRVFRLVLGVTALHYLELVAECVEPAGQHDDAHVAAPALEPRGREAVIHDLRLGQRLSQHVTEVAVLVPVLADEDQHGEREGDPGGARDRVERHRPDRRRRPEIELDHRLWDVPPPHGPLVGPATPVVETVGQLQGVARIRAVVVIRRRVELAGLAGCEVYTGSRVGDARGLEGDQRRGQRQRHNVPARGPPGAVLVSTPHDRIIPYPPRQGVSSPES